MIVVAYAIALTAIGWTQWVRLATWRNPYSRLLAPVIGALADRALAGS